MTTHLVYVSGMGGLINAYKFLSDDLNGRDHVEDTGVYGKILIWMLGN